MNLIASHDHFHQISILETNLFLSSLPQNGNGRQPPKLHIQKTKKQNKMLQKRGESLLSFLPTILSSNQKTKELFGSQ